MIHWSKVLPYKKKRTFFPKKFFLRIFFQMEKRERIEKNLSQNFSRRNKKIRPLDKSRQLQTLQNKIQNFFEFERSFSYQKKKNFRIFHIFPPEKSRKKSGRIFF